MCHTQHLLTGMLHTPIPIVQVQACVRFRWKTIWANTHFIAVCVCECSYSDQKWPTLKEPLVRLAWKRHTPPINHECVILMCEANCCWMPSKAERRCELFITMNDHHQRVCYNGITMMWKVEITSVYYYTMMCGWRLREWFYSWFAITDNWLRLMNN